MIENRTANKGGTPLPEAKRPGQYPGRNAKGARTITVRPENSFPEDEQLLEAVVERENLVKAHKKVVGNKGSAGIDGMRVEELMPYLWKNWERIKEELREDRYKPQAVKQVEIPKRGKKEKRKLGIPTVVDRFIQQALMQKMAPRWEAEFSENSYGFRPKRNAQQAIRKAKEYVREGREIVVDIDIEKFFDRVNQDVLMSRIARKIKDKRVLHLIRKYLQAGIMINGVEETRNEGTPQGSPLSPLLANILLDELDKELEKRGHKFSRYADDCNIYVRTVKAGERVKESIGKFLEKRLRLKLNEEKSGVGKVHERSFLGYSFTNQEEKRIKISKGAIKRLKKKVKEIFRKGKGKNLKKMIIEELVPILRGWINYFRESEAGSILERIDGWIRRRLRAIIWRQCKKKYTRVKRMMKRGVSEEVAWQTGGSRTGRWRGTRNYGWHKAFPNAYFERLGLISLHQRWFALRSNS